MELLQQPIPKTVTTHQLMIRVARMIDHYRNGNRRIRFRSELVKRMDDPSVVVFGVRIPPREVKIFRLLKSMEWEIAMNYIGLVKSIVKKLHRESTYLDFNDLVNEGMIAILDAIYGYHGRFHGCRVSFTTYAQKTLENRIAKIINRTVTGRLRSADHIPSLILKYERVKQGFNRAVLFDEIVDKMELNSSSRKRLTKALLKVRHDDGKIELIASVQHEQLEYDEREKLDKVMDELNPFQRAVIKGCMSGHHGWQAEVAAKYINPKTGKPYSRRTPHCVLKQIQQLLNS